MLIRILKRVFWSIQRSSFCASISLTLVELDDWDDPRRVSLFNGFSFNHPDSLTRRGDVLIARRALSNGRNHDNALAEWQELIEELFSGQVVIYDTRVYHF